MTRALLAVFLLTFGRGAIAQNSASDAADATMAAIRAARARAATAHPTGTSAMNRTPRVHPTLLRRTIWAMMSASDGAVVIRLDADGGGTLAIAPVQVGLDGQLVAQPITSSSRITWWVQDGNTFCVQGRKPDAAPLCAPAVVQGDSMDWNRDRWAKRAYRLPMQSGTSAGTGTGTGTHAPPR